MPAAAGCRDGDAGPWRKEAGTEDRAIAAVKLLLDQTDINAVDRNGETAMHGAAYKNSRRWFASTAANGADIKVWNQKNKYGWTPHLIAEEHRRQLQTSGGNAGRDSFPSCRKRTGHGVHARQAVNDNYRTSRPQAAWLRLPQAAGAGTENLPFAIEVSGEHFGQIASTVGEGWGLHSDSVE